MRKRIILLLILLLCPIFVDAEITQKKYGTYEQAIKNVEEVMKAYYMKGSSFQYNYSKAQYGKNSPEDATSQDNKYLVCAAYTYSVYTEAFGMVGGTYYMENNDVFKDHLFPQYNYQILAAADNYHRKIKSNDIASDGKLLIYYESTTTDNDNKEKREDEKKNIIGIRTRSIQRYVYGHKDDDTKTKDLETLVNNVQPGDLFVYSGHALIAYGTAINPKTNKKDVLILNSKQEPYILTRIDGTSKLSYNFNKGSLNNYIDIDGEGTIQYTWLSSINEFVQNGKLNCKKAECAVVRPFYEGSNGEAIFNYSIKEDNYKKSELRSKYPGLFIEKTVSTGDNNSVNIGDTLEYTITITNKSGVNYNAISYKAFNIEETISEYVDYISSSSDGKYSNGKLTWEIASLAADKSKTLTYTVKVKNNTANVNKTITSIGKFYSPTNTNLSISTGTVENKIVPKVTKLKTSYSECYNIKKDSYTGLNLINQIYDCATKNDFKFNEFKFANLFDKKVGTSNNSAKINIKSSLDEKHTKFSNMILNNYFSGLTTDGTNYFFPRWSSNSSENRARTINSSDFKDGDVLIYEINNSKHTYESGVYAYIYLESKGYFVGVNGSNDTKRNVFYPTYYTAAYWQDNGSTKTLTVANNLYDGNWNNTTSEQKKFINYQTLYDKDNYVILRPELVMKEIVKIEVMNEPTKTNYIQNYEELDLSGGSIKVTYNDNATNTISMTNVNVVSSGFDNSKVGMNSITITYSGYETSFETEIISRQSTKIEVINKPTKINYIQNYEELDLSGGSIKVTYNDNTTDTISMDNENVIVSGFDNSKEGTNTITLTYNGHTTKFNVTIVSKQILSLDIIELPIKTNYIQNYETLDLNGGRMKVVYNDNTFDTISMENENVIVSGFDNSKLGLNTITLTYNGHELTFDVTIIKKQILGIEISEKPSKINYIQNYEELDLSGGIIKVTYSDGTTTNISMENEKVKVSGFDNSKIGLNIITVEYEGKKITFDIEIISKQISSIEINAKPSKINYIQNYETIDLTGGSIKVTYNDNTTDIISMENEKVKASDFDNSKLGPNTITVSYEGRTVTFDVEIISKQISRLELDTMPTKSTYIQNYEELDLSGGIIKIVYNDNTIANISMDNDKVNLISFDNSKIGMSTVKLEYEGHTLSFDVEILSKQIIKLELDTMPIKSTYIQNYETLDLTGGIIKVTYSDGTTTNISMDNDKVKLISFDNSKLGMSTVKLEYEGHTLSFDVEIILKQIIKLELDTMPIKLTYIQNYETIDLTGGIIKVTYSDGTTTNISMDNEKVKVSGFDNSKVGKSVVTVSYEDHTLHFELEIVSKQISKIEISTKPMKTTYIQNYEDLDLAGGVIKVTYDDKTIDTISMDNEKVKVSGFDNSKAGINTLTVEYFSKKATFEVNIISKQISKIEISTKPMKSIYIQNYEELDLTGGVIKITYSDKTTDTISMDNEKVKVSGFDNSKLGKNTITVSYEGTKVTFEVEIVSKQILKIEISTKPIKIDYIQNYEDLDLAGGIIKVTYDDKTTDTISMDNEKIKVSGFDNSKAGTNTITVEYEEKKATFDIMILSKQISKIEMSTKPMKTTYIQNYEKLDLTGGSIKVIYNDNTFDTIAMDNEKVKVSGFDNSKLGTNTLTVEYEGCTVNFDIKIILKQISKIEMSTKPMKTTYIQNYEKLDLTGGVIKITYDDKTIDTISMENEKVKVSGFDNSKLGTNTITIEYEGKKVTFDIVIISKQIEKIEISTMPMKTTYIQNYEKLDLKGGNIKITYTDKTIDTISMDNEKVKVSGFNNSEVGNIDVTLEYEGHKIVLNIEIVSKQIVKVEIDTKPIKTKYIQNYEKLDLTGGIIKVIYNDNTTDTISMDNEKVKVSGFDNSKVGTNNIVIEYYGYQEKFNVEIISKQISKIEISTKPMKTNYIQNYEKLDLTGGIIKITYDDKTIDTVSMDNEKIKVSGFDNSKVGVNTITVEYNNKTATFEVEVISKQIIKIEVESYPIKKKYVQNDKKLDLTGGNIKITYNDKTTDTISMDNEKVKVSGFDNTKIGTNSLTVKYEGHSTTFDIEVTKGPENVTENPKTGITNVFIIMITSLVSLIFGYIFYKRYRLNLNSSN